MFSETQKASGAKKTAGALEETPALFIHLLRKAFRKGVAAAPPLSMRYGLPDPPAHQREEAVGQHSPAIIKGTWKR